MLCLQCTSVSWHCLQTRGVFEAFDIEVRDCVASTIRGAFCSSKKKSPSALVDVSDASSLDNTAVVCCTPRSTSVCFRAASTDRCSGASLRSLASVLIEHNEHVRILCTCRDFASA